MISPPSGWNSTGLKTVFPWPSAALTGAVHSPPSGLRLHRTSTSEAPSLEPPKKAHNKSPFSSSSSVAAWHELKNGELLKTNSSSTKPGFAQAHYQLGVVLEKTGRTEEAIPELEKAARLDPGFAEPQYTLSRLHRRKGDREKADRALARFREIKKEQGRPVTEPR